MSVRWNGWTFVGSSFSRMEFPLFQPASASNLNSPAGRSFAFYRIDLLNFQNFWYATEYADILKMNPMNDQERTTLHSLFGRTVIRVDNNLVVKSGNLRSHEAQTCKQKTNNSNKFTRAVRMDKQGSCWFYYKFEWYSGFSLITLAPVSNRRMMNANYWSLVIDI